MFSLFKKINFLANSKILVILIIITIILFIKKFDAIINPQFWAEDGKVFFLDQYLYGISAIFRPYNGYILLVPRLIAFFTDLFFPYSAAPYVYNYSSLILTLVVVANIYSRRFSVKNKTLLSLAVVLVPHPNNEIFLNITNIQWFLAILLIITLLKSPPHPQYGNIYWQKFLDYAVIIFCGLTGPFIIFLSPFFIGKYLKNKSQYNLILTGLVILITSIQLFCLIGFTSRLNFQKTLINSQGNSLYNTARIYARVFIEKFFGNLFLGIVIPYKVSAYIIVLLEIIIIGIIIYVWTKTSEKNKFFIKHFLSISVVFLVFSLIRLQNNLLDFIHPYNGQRYLYLSYVMIIWSLIICIEKNREWRNVATIVILGIILFSSLTAKFQSDPFTNYNWQGYSKLIGKEENLLIPINPPGWYIDLSAKTDNRGTATKFKVKPKLQSN